MLQGNYWLDLIRFEKELKSHIERAVQKFVGMKTGKDSEELKRNITHMVAKHLDILSQMKNLNPFEVDYDIEMEFNGNVLVKFKVTNVMVV